MIEEIMYLIIKQLLVLPQSAELPWSNASFLIFLGFFFFLFFPTKLVIWSIETFGNVIIMAWQPNTSGRMWLALGKKKKITSLLCSLNNFFPSC